jgi:hypothetical protein
LLAITFRRDPNNYRPRINKENSVKVWYISLKKIYNCIFSLKLNANFLIFLFGVK